MGALLTLLGRQARPALVVSVIVGLLFPRARDILEPVLPVIVILLLALGMVRVSPAQIISSLRGVGRLLASLVFLMILMPVLVHGAATAVHLPAPLHLGAVLVVCAAPLAFAVNLAFMMRLNGGLALILTLLGALCLPVVGALMVAVTVGPETAIAPAVFTARLLVTVGIAAAIAALVRRLAGSERLALQGDLLDGASVIMMTLFALAIMGEVTWVALADPARIPAGLAVVLAVNFGVQLVSMALLVPLALYTRLLSPQHALTLAMVAGNRNVAIFLAALPADLAASILLFVALYQIPIYLTPFVMGPVYRRLLARLNRGA